MLEYMLYALFLVLGCAIGYLLRSWSDRQNVGTIHVTLREGQTLYSLELLDYPETIRFRKRVYFDVDTSEYEDRE
jgi:hypothetical protein